MHLREVEQERWCDDSNFDNPQFFIRIDEMRNCESVDFRNFGGSEPLIAFKFVDIIRLTSEGFDGRSASRLPNASMGSRFQRMLKEDLDFDQFCVQFRSFFEEANPSWEHAGKTAIPRSSKSICSLATRNFPWPKYVRTSLSCREYCQIHTETTAKIVIKVDDDEEERDVFLHRGSSPGVRQVEYI